MENSTNKKFHCWKTPRRKISSKENSTLERFHPCTIRPRMILHALIRQFARFSYFLNQAIFTRVANDRQP